MLRWMPPVCAALIGLGAAPLTATASTGSTASTAADVTADAAAVHVGDTITLEVAGCAAPATVTGVTLLTATEGKGWPPPMALALADLDVTPAASGVRFTYVPTEAKVRLGFEVACSDGATLITDPLYAVHVFPPAGRLWFLSVYGTLRARAGVVTTLSVRSLECASGEVATASVELGGGRPPLTATAVVGASIPTAMDFALDVPLATPPGEYPLRVTCPTASGSLADRANLFVDSEIAVTGSADAGRSAALAATSLAVGCVLVAVARRRTNRRSPAAV